MKLIEREMELATLRNLFAETLSGHGRVIVIDGAVASGKTALLRTFIERAAGSGAEFLTATAARAERGVPLSVLMELFRGTEFPSGAQNDMERLLDEGLGFAAFDHGEVRPETAAQVTGPVFEELCKVLLRRAARAPLLIGIDDVHHADPASLRFLLYIAHRLRSARILVLLTERAGPWREHPQFHADLLSQPHCRRIRLAPLSRHGQERLLAARLGARAGRRLAPACQVITGGNPLLVRAVLKDNDRLRAADAAELTVDAAFQQAVMSCLHRGGPAMTGIARVLAILREPASPALLGGLLDLDTEHVADTIDAMNVAGLLNAGRFRHPAARTVVLDGMAPEQRTALHARAARLLHDHGAAPMLVAGHLRAAASAAATAEPWALPVLEEAGEQALAAGEPHTALSYLRLAYDTSPEEGRARVTGALARTEWRIDPTAVDRLLPALVAAAGEGRLARRHAIRPLGYLMWYGRADEAFTVLERVADSATARPDGTAPELAATRLLMSCFSPDAADRAGAGRIAAEDRGDVSAAANRQLRAAAALSAVLTGAPGHDVSGIAEQVLQGTRLSETPPEYVVAALAALVYDDRPERAAHWCGDLLEEAAARRDTVAHAALATARAMIGVRQGDMVAAELHARAALSRLSPAGWGVAIGLPIAMLVGATTALGRYEDAATYLGVAVPEAMFQTPGGLHYLQARGNYYLATGHARAALADFQACGELMGRWGFDVPGLVTWRTDAARAHIELGDIARAAELTAEQLAGLRPGPSRTRGIALRVQALTAGPGDRRRLLWEAITVLEQSGDQYELEHALGDLSRIRQPGGDHDLAFASARSARHQAGREGTEPPAFFTDLRPAPRPDSRTDPPADPPGRAEAADPSSGPHPDPPSELTDAERKVATLAAQGYTNRQIAGELLVTVSTVEQHLTRVYRKLNVNRRADLQPEP